MDRYMLLFYSSMELWNVTFPFPKAGEVSVTEVCCTLSIVVDSSLPIGMTEKKKITEPFGYGDLSF